MLTIAISLLFGLTAFAALVVIHSSLAIGARHRCLILAELADIERQNAVAQTAAPRLQPALRPRFAAA